MNEYVHNFVSVRLSRSQMAALPLLQLEALSETLLDFNHLEALLTWLQVNQPSADDRLPEVKE